MSSASADVHIIASDEEVVVHVAGFAVLRATYEAEGYYDETAGGDPAEEDLYRIEVLDSASAVQAAEALDGEAAGPLVDLGLRSSVLHRLFPAERWDGDAETPGLVARYLLALADALARAPGPVDRQRLLEASAGWSAAVIEDRFRALTDEWRRHHLEGRD